MSEMRCAEVPVVRPPSELSGDCDEIEHQVMKGGSTATWTLAKVEVTNPDEDSN